MDSLKKLILMSLIPALLTIFFVVKFTIPSVKTYFELKKDIKKETIAINDLKTNIESLKANQALISKLEGLNSELIGFDVEFPKEFGDEILLIDLELFADEAVNRILKVRSMPEADVEIIDPSKVGEKKKKRASRRGKEEKKDKGPVSIMEKPLELATVAHYKEIIEFVNFLENYQRKINIQGIYTDVFNDDRKVSDPRVHLKIKGSIYKSEIRKPQRAVVPDTTENTDGTKENAEITQSTRTI